MKQSEAKEFLPLIQAWAEGKTLQVLDGGYWDTDECLVFNESVTHYRIKPEPKLRPWKPEEVPVGTLVRQIHYNTIPEAWRGVILAANQHHIVTTNGSTDKGGNGIVEESFDYARRKYEHSTDGGKTWQPCGVIE